MDLRHYCSGATAGILLYNLLWLTPHYNLCLHNIKPIVAYPTLCQIGSMRLRQ